MGRAHILLLLFGCAMALLTLHLARDVVSTSAIRNTGLQLLRTGGGACTGTHCGGGGSGGTVTPPQLGTTSTRPLQPAVSMDGFLPPFPPMTQPPSLQNGVPCLFVHVPKTAGTSLRRHLVAASRSSVPTTHVCVPGVEPPLVHTSEELGTLTACRVVGRNHVLVVCSSRVAPWVRVGGKRGSVFFFCKFAHGGFPPSLSLPPPPPHCPPAPHRSRLLLIVTYRWEVTSTTTSRLGRC